MVDVGANIAEGLAAVAGSLEEDACDAEIASLAADCGIDRGAGFVGHRCRYGRIVFERRQHAVAHGTRLADHLGCAEEIRRLRQVVALDLKVFAVDEDRRAADATRIEHARRGTPAEGYGGPCAAELGTGAPVAPLERRGRTSRRIEDLAALDEEQALVREIGLPGGEVDHRIVGLDRSEIRQRRRRDLEVGRRSPEHIDAGAPVVAAVAVVQRRGGIGKEVELSLGGDIRHFHWLKRGHEPCTAHGQGGPTPAFVDVGDPPAGEETHCPFAVRGRHGHH